MPDASPADVAEGQEPEADEGQEPDDDQTDEPEGRSGKPSKSYPESYVRQLRRESATHRNRVAELEEKLQEHADAGKTEQEKLVEKMAASEKRAADAETRLLRFEVARDRGLSLEAASFLAGSTREEMELRADELAKLLEDRGSKPSISFDGGARGTPAPPKGPPDQEHNDFLIKAIQRRVPS